MKAFRVTSAMVVVLGVASTSSAAIMVTNYWRMGEADGNPPDGSAVTTTTRTTGGFDLSTVPAAPPTTNTYSTDTGAAGTTRSISLAGGGRLFGNTNFTATNNYGIEAWVNPTTLSATLQTVFSIDATATRIALRLRTDGANLRQQNGSQDMNWTGLASLGLVPNAWTHLALVRDTGTTRLYVNGMEAVNMTGDPAGAPVASFNPPQIFIGRGSDGFPNLLTGKIDEVRLFTFEPGQFQTSDLLYPVVPEPATGLMGLSVLGLAILFHRRRA